MLGKEKFACVEDAIETYLSDFRFDLSDYEYSSIYDELVDRNEFVWKDMEVGEIFYEVEAFVDGFLFCKRC